jgi:hypothetical protein
VKTFHAQTMLQHVQPLQTTVIQVSALTVLSHKTHAPLDTHVTLRLEILTKDTVLQQLLTALKETQSQLHALLLKHVQQLERPQLVSLLIAQPMPPHALQTQTTVTVVAIALFVLQEFVLLVTRVISNQHLPLLACAKNKLPQPLVVLTTLSQQHALLSRTVSRPPWVPTLHNQLVSLSTALPIPPLVTPTPTTATLAVHALSVP